MFGSARCCSFSPLFHKTILQGNNTTVHLSLFLRNIREEDAQVAYICIFSIYMHILHILHIFSGWIDRVNSAMIYERKSNKQVLYVLPITSILSKLPLVPVGDTGTIPYSMRGETADFDGGFCDSKPGEGREPVVVSKLLGNVLVIQDVGLQKQ